MKTAIEISNLSKKYLVGRKQPYLSLRDSLFKRKKNKEEFWALRNINLTIRQGDRVALIGKNGAGKSTLLKILSRITYPTSGEVTIYKKMSSLLEVGTGFHPELTGRENVYFNGAILGLRKQEVTKYFDEIVEFSGVAAFIDAPLKQYSSGMQMRLAFAVAAFLQPEILIVDEVLSVGDFEFQEKCIGKMQELGRTDHRTLIFVSHNMAALKQLCNSGVILEKGEIAYAGNIESSIAKYLHKPLHSDGAETDLSTHPDKITNQGLLNATILINGVMSNVLFSGDHLEIALTFFTEAPLLNGEIGIVIKDKNGDPVIGLNNKHLGKKLQIRSGLQHAVISMPHVNIYYPGNYSVDLFFGDFHHFYESLYNCLQFEVRSSDVYQSGVLLDADMNRIVVSNINIEVGESRFKNI